MTASRPAASLPHTGIATFCKAPYVFDPAEIDADIAILGARHPKTEATAAEKGWHRNCANANNN